MSENGTVVRAHARCVRKESIQLPPGKRIPSGWTASPAGSGADVLELYWEPAEAERWLAALERHDADPDARRREPYIRLRLTNALDYRHEQLVEVRLRSSGTALGAIDVRYAYAFQYFELPLTADQARAALAEGVALDHRGSGPLWFLDDRNAGPDREKAAFAPHLLFTAETSSAADDRVAAAVDALLSLRSLQPFGWIEGCVLDGILAVARRASGELRDRADAALRLHFAQFMTEDGRLVYEDLRGNAADGTFTTIEATLPVAAAAQLDKNHPLIPQAIRFFQAKAGADGLVIDGEMVSAEGCYTVAYPLAVLAAAAGNGELANQALQQVLLRKRYLRGERSVHLRWYLNRQEHTFTNWSRAFGWYCLGMTKTYLTLSSAESIRPDPEAMAALRAEIADVLRLALSYLPPSRVWSVFFDRPDTGAETSGTAAVAAALALAAEHGIIDSSCRSEAESIHAALLAFITPDGLFGGVSQHNAGGMRLQESGYRVLSQMGLGLWGQLHATLAFPPSH